MSRAAKSLTNTTETVLGSWDEGIFRWWTSVWLEIEEIKVVLAAYRYVDEDRAALQKETGSRSSLL